MRDEKGLLVYDDEFRRRFMTPKEIAEGDKWVKNHSALIDAKERGELTEQKYERLCNELDTKHAEELSRIYDEDFGSKSRSTDKETFFAQPHFAIA